MQKLDVGDYGCEYTDGSRCPFYFERKSIGDLFGTMTSGYKRFKKELARAKESGSLLILAIEGTHTEVTRGITRSEFSGESMIAKLNTLFLKYNLVSMLFDSRIRMAEWIAAFYESFGRLFKSDNSSFKQLVVNNSNPPNPMIPSNPLQQNDLQ